MRWDVERAIHAAFAATLLVVLSPLLLLVAVFVRLSSPGPVLHRAVRVGRNGRTFVLYKFRTMVVDRAVLGPRITAANDPRITRVGGVLRRSKLDELPQLWNVVRGDMRLVGPRPEDPRFVALYGPDQQQVLSIAPGITGPAQLTFLDEEELLRSADPEATYVREILPRKLAIDMAYAEHRTIGLDIQILAQTGLAALRAVGSRAAGSARPTAGLTPRV
jgi:lipopolysaccharide/colanic/teichoic acid biosynthesis glycosyltransferase